MSPRASRLAAVIWLLVSGGYVQSDCAETTPPPTTQPAEELRSVHGEQSDQRPIVRRLTDRIDQVKIEAPAKDAFAWWSRTTKIPLVVNWNGLQEQGIDAEAPISLDLRNVPSGQVLGLLMTQTSSDHPLIFESSSSYIEIMTRDDANKRLVLRSYDIKDLLHAPGEISVPSFNISEAFESGSSRDRSGESDHDRNLFDDDSGTSSSAQRVMDKSPEQRGDEIAQIIRDTVEPDVWRDNGGSASIRYFQGKLLVNAPLYVHSQIGLSADNDQAIGVNPRRYLRDTDTATSRPTGASRGISSVDKSKASAVSGQERR